MNSIRKTILLTLILSSVIFLSGCINQPAAFTSDIPVNINGGFEQGILPWKLFTNGIATFTATSPGYVGTYKGQVSITTVGNNTQIYIPSVVMTSGKKYMLSYYAYSSTGHDVKVAVLKHTSPYTIYGLSTVSDLTTGWKKFTHNFTATGFTGTATDVRLRFTFDGVASANDKYYFDEVNLKEIVTTLPTPTSTPIITPTPPVSTTPTPTPVVTTPAPTPILTPTPTPPTPVKPMNPIDAAFDSLMSFIIKLFQVKS